MSAGDGPAGRAERGPERAGKPAATGSGTAGAESQLVELQTRVGGLETVSERAEDRWEKSRTDQEGTKQEIVVQAAMKKELAELRKEQMELRKEIGVGFRRVDEKMDAGFRQVGEKFDAMGREIAAVSRRVDEKWEKFTEKLEELRQESEQLAQQFIRRVELIALLILAAILGTGIFG